MPTVYGRVKKVVIEQLGVDDPQVVANASFADDLNADSLDLVELIMALEEEFSDGAQSLRIADEDAEQIHTIQNAVDYIHGQGIQD